MPGDGALKKGQELLGMAVVDQQTGKQLGVVRDVYFDASWRLKGLIVENKGLFRQGRCIPLEQLNIGEDAVMVDEDAVMQQLPEGMYTLYSGENKLAGKSVMTKDGDGLGQIHDVYFLEEMGTLIGCELSDGLLSDLRHGRKFVPWRPDVTVGEDVVFFPEV
nr:photosystem reaction center subunit H [Bacillota bacterium]